MTEPGGGSGDGTDGPATDAPRPAAELVDPWTEFSSRRRYDHTQIFPPDDETLEVGSAPERLVKRAIARLIRPVVRRYDRLLAEAAAMNAELARSVAETQATVGLLVEQTRAIAAELREVATMTKEHDVRIGRAATELDLLADRVAAGIPVAPADGRDADGAVAPKSGGAGSAPPSHVLPDAFYWRFETALRGRPEAVTEKLGAYRELAEELRDRHGDEALWLDVGCGEGAFMVLLHDWGWRVLGMDHSPQAVEACVARGLAAVEGSLPGFLLDFDGGAPAAISLIQVIEHLSTETWLPTLRYAERLLAPGGALVIETIDPRNPEALQAFFADVTHTWAAHPGTLEVMAGFAGFTDTQVIGLNPGEDGRSQDFALVARKA